MVIYGNFGASAPPKKNTKDLVRNSILEELGPDFEQRKMYLWLNQTMQNRLTLNSHLRLL